MRALALEAFQGCADPAVLSGFEFMIGDLPQAKADRTLILQVWTNLLDNAVKYSCPPPGTGLKWKVLYGTTAQ